MNGLKALNTIALVIPVTLLVLSIINDGFLTLSVISTILTGFIQVTTGIFFWYKFRNSIHIKIYFILVTIFFLVLFIGITDDWIWCLPPALCLYLSVIIYSKKSVS